MNRMINKESMLKEKYMYILLGCYFCIWGFLSMINPNHWILYLFACVLLFLITIFLIFRWLIKCASAVRSHYSLSAPTLQIAHETMPLLRGGFNADTAQKVAEIIQRTSDVAAVAITDQEKVLAFIGAGCENHPAGMPIVTQATLNAITTGKLVVVKNKNEFNCKRKDCLCPLESAVIVPLISGTRVIGTVKLYQTHAGQIANHIIKLAEGISQLLSMQIEIAELDHQAKLVTEAQLDALQAQINPHFLFNTLNTIGMFIRTNPDMAGKLLQHLASFLRHSLRRRGRFITLEEEIKFVSKYLILEKARFQEKLHIIRKIDKRLLSCEIPVLSIQLLVENAIKHGVTLKEGKGTVQICAKLLDNYQMEIAICDDGVGIHPEVMMNILEPSSGSGSGVGLSNVHERLIILYGENSGLHIISEPGMGTKVSFRIPINFSIA